MEQPKSRYSGELAGVRVFRSARTPFFQMLAVRVVKPEVIEDPTTSSLSLRAMAILFAIPLIGTRAFILPVSLVQRKALMVALSDSEEKPTTWPRLLISLAAFPNALLSFPPSDLRSMG